MSLRRRIFARAHSLPGLPRNPLHVGQAHRSVHRPDVHHPAGFESVKPRVSADRLGVIKIKDEVSIRYFTLAPFFEAISPIGREFSDLPDLAFVFTEVLYDERLYRCDLQQSLARRMNRKPAKVACDPSSIQLLGHSGRRAAAHEAVEN